MHNRVAVLVAGELRYWDKTAPTIVNAFDKYGNTVDYYIAAWSSSACPVYGEAFNPVTTAVTSEYVLSHFPSNKVECFVVSDQISAKLKSTYDKQSYLAKVANTIKNRRELADNFVYDLVVEVRPDLYIIDFPEPPLLANFEFATTSSHTPQHVLRNAEDVFCVTDSVTNDIMTARGMFNKIELAHTVAVNSMFSHGHWRIAKFRKSFMLQFVHLHDFKCHIFRSNSPADPSTISPQLAEQLELEYYAMSQRYYGSSSPHAEKLPL